MERKLGIGIVGCGGIANAKHIPNLLKDSRIEIKGLFDGVAPDRASEMIRKFSLRNCKAYPSFEALVEQTDIDIIHVCTPNDSHAPLTIKALNAGKHVMCEKPMAQTLEQAEQMLAAAKLSGKKLTIAANNRFREDSWHLKKLCLQNELGHIYYAKAHAVRRRGVPLWGSFINKEVQGGGPVIDIGTHALDMALWFMNNYEPASVTAKTYNLLAQETSPANPYGNWKSSDFTVEDMGVALIIMKNGASILLESSWALNIRDEKAGRVTLCGTKAGADMDTGLVLNGEENGKLYDRTIMLNPPSIPFYTPPAVSGPEREIQTWISSVLNNTEPVVTPEQMLQVMKIISAVYESAESGKTVYF
jgi:predicted dehydrogenase